MAPVLVSVVVPVFNGARFLGDCLRSLLAQDHPSLDIVVVDNGSSDGSGRLAESFAGVRVLTRSHASIAASRNAGVVAARGSLIGFCDCDDMWKPEKASRQVEYLVVHPDVAVVLCRQEIMFESGAAWPEWLRPDQVRGDLDGVQPASGLYRREVFDRLGGYRTGGIVERFSLDLLFCARRAGMPIAVLEDVLTIRRIHDDNETSRGSFVGPMLAAVRDHLSRGT